MSSIAYITDREMIEYHRLHGNSEIAFWRFANQKKFQNFHHGDYLFFLTKGTEKGKKREKGIVGYGRYVKDDHGSVKHIWKKYQTKCGYGSEEQLIHALSKVNKARTLPKQIHCLLLEHVIFFQAPIYLSELAKIISKQVESYIYLDQEDSETAWKILKKGEEIGIDVWSTFVEQKDVVIQNDADIIAVSQKHEQLSDDYYTSYEKKKTASFVNAILANKQGAFLAGSQDDFWVEDNGQICFCIPCLLSLKAWKRHLLLALAKASIYQNTLKHMQSNSKVVIVTDEAQKEAQQLCDCCGIAYRMIQKEKK